jgi:hypothetical protein|tara:strand:- start:658 stop:831 length:174 start_codon:yes stop_codon:yes gene_type:complete
MSYKDIMLETYIAEIDYLRSKVLQEQSENLTLYKTIHEKEIIIKLLKNKNKAYDKFN